MMAPRSTPRTTWEAGGARSPFGAGRAFLCRDDLRRQETSDELSSYLTETRIPHKRLQQHGTAASENHTLWLGSPPVICALRRTFAGID
jgi:hypothetical protein